MTYDTSPASPQRIELSGRESLTVSGVEDVDRFDETEIVMNTSLGVLVVTGRRLHIGKPEPRRRASCMSTAHRRHRL